MNYTELQAMVKKYLGREDLDAMIPQFIRLAETRMNRELRLKSMEKTAVLMTVPGQAELPLPDDRTDGTWNVFLELRSIASGGGPLSEMGFVPLGSLSRHTSAGSYSIQQRSLVLSPVPDGEYPISIVYYAEIPPLSATQATNDVLLRYQDLYLYSTLIESVGYTRTSAPADLWGTLYNAAKTQAQASDEKGRFTAIPVMQGKRAI